MDTNPLRIGIEGIVLDAVGTLIEPSTPVADVYVAAARRQGVALERDLVRDRFRRQFRDDETCGPMETDESRERDRWAGIVATVLAEVPDPGRAFRELWDHFAQPESWRCFPEVGAALGRFRAAGWKVGVGSNFDGRLRRIVAGLPELNDLEGSLVISAEVGVRKPDARFYEAACERLGLPAARLVFAGDHLENDVQGPNRAGMRAVLVDRGRSAPGAGVMRVASLLELVVGGS
jgi:putative hydrolase of the HAD superfamily